jgi:hypothetical protein
MAATGTQYRCSQGERRELVRDKRILNGIDFLEVAFDPGQNLPVLSLHLIHPWPAAAPLLGAGNIRIEGGERVRRIEVTTVASAVDSDEVTIRVDRDGDFSTYTLRLVTGPDNPSPPAGIDRQLAAVDFSFKVDCPNDFDCADEPFCPEVPLPVPEIDYLAKDYASFRQTMLDRMATLLPAWRERNAADFGVTLVELLAYVADRLSYQQDAVGTEAYLGTARRRVSVRRHARLVDYRMHDGHNARTWVHFTLAPGGPVTVTLPKQVGDVPPFRVATHQPERTTVVDTGAIPDLIAAGAEFFEPMWRSTRPDEAADAVQLDPAHNELAFYTWGASDCCLPAGATRATLRGDLATLAPGDVLIFVERRDPWTGQEADADPAHRHAVRLVEITPGHDPLFPTAANPEGLPVTDVAWHPEDALPFPLCISAVTRDGLVDEITVALGNNVLCDHGLTLPEASGVHPEDLGRVPPPHLFRVPARRVASEIGGLPFETTDEASPFPNRPAVPPRFRPALRHGPLSFASAHPFAAETAGDPRPALAATRSRQEEATPQIRLDSRRDDGFGPPAVDPDAPWTPRFDLLGSGRAATDFVVEVEADGIASLRFGNNVNGRRPPSGTAFDARYRTGNGVAGNVGVEALCHLLIADPALMTGAAGPVVVAVDNPLPAWGGVDPESIERVRQRAPYAFLRQERAVTPDDYAAQVQRHPAVQRARATARWTGSWYTMFISVDPFGGRRIRDDPGFERELRAWIEPYRMVGHDVEFDDAILVPLEIEFDLCVERGHYRSDVETALRDVFSDRVLPDRRLGMFHPDRLTFGQSVYLGPLLAAAEAVRGVASVQATVFRRQGTADTAALLAGELKLGRLEIPLLANDANFANRGVFRLNVGGGE